MLGVGNQNGGDIRLAVSPIVICFPVRALGGEVKLESTARAIVRRVKGG